MASEVKTDRNNEGDFALAMGNMCIPAQELRCPGCVPPNTMISAYPYKDIASSEVGEITYGHAARHEANIVEEVFLHDYDGELIVIKAQGCLPIELTPEHEVFVLAGKKRNFSAPGNPRIKLEKSAKWIKASDVTSRPNPYAKESIGHYLLLPAAKGCYTSSRVSLLRFMNKNGRRVFTSKGFSHSFPINNDTAWLVGLYVADGWSGSKEVAFSLGNKDTQTQNKLLEVVRGLGFSPRTEVIPSEQAVNIYLPSRVLRRFFRYWCGHKAKEKHIPKFIIDNCDDRILLSFLGGYIAGDGYAKSLEQKSWRITASTVSKPLALQLQLLGARLGQLFSVHERKNGVSSIAGRLIKGNVIYVIDIFPGNVTKELGFNKEPYRPKYRRLRHYLAIPISKIEKKHYIGPVMNLKTRNETFLVNNLVVHNCRRFLGYQAIAWGAIKIKCPNCKQWTVLDVSPKK